MLRPDGRPSGRFAENDRGGEQSDWPWLAPRRRRFAQSDASAGGLRGLLERFLLTAQLKVVDLSIEAALAQELLVRGPLHDPPVLEHQDLVRHLHGAQTLGSD